MITVPLNPWIDRAFHQHSRRVPENPAAQPPGARRARSDDPNPGRAVLVELRPPRDEVLVLLVPRRHPWLRAEPVGDEREVRRRRRDRARHRRRWHRQAAGPVGPARGASRNTQARARHNEASQKKPPPTDVRHRRHDAILDTNTQSRRSHVATDNVITGPPPAARSPALPPVLPHAVWEEADRPRPTPAQRRPHRHASLNAS
jgi:hypothetical protein